MILTLLACTATLGVAPDPGEAATLPQADVTITACDEDPEHDPSPDSITEYWFAPGVAPDRPTLAYFWMSELLGGSPGTVENGEWLPAGRLEWQEDGVIAVSAVSVSGCYVYQW